MMQTSPSPNKIDESKRKYVIALKTVALAVLGGFENLIIINVINVGSPIRRTNKALDACQKSLIIL